MIVAVEQSGDARALVFGSESGVWNVVDRNRLVVEIPEHRPDVARVVNPRPQPHKVAALHKLAGHLGVRGRERLEEMKDARVADRPGHEHEHEGRREERTVQSCARETRLELDVWVSTA